MSCKRFQTANVTTEVSTVTALFGALVGHFGSPNDNAGVAIVIPIDAIRELVDDPRLVKWRNQEAVRMEDQRQRRNDEAAAHLDSVESQSEFERFEDLTRKLVNVPKNELDEKRKEEES